MRSRSAALSVVLLALVASSMGCGTSSVAPDDDRIRDPNLGVASGTVDVLVDRPSIRLRNESTDVVTYFLYEKETLTRATFPPCGDQVTRLTPREEVVIPYTAIIGYTADATEAGVFWCNLVRNADGTWKPLGTMQGKFFRL